MTLVIPIGIPASGKSTLAKEYQSRGFTIINPDSIRMEMYGDYDANTDELWEEVGDRLEACLEAPEGLCYIDATNIKQWEREPHIEKAKAKGHKVKAIHLKTHPRIAEFLNKQRDRQVPWFVIYEKHYGLQRPKPEEGFDEIETRTFPLTPDLCRKIRGRPKGDRCSIIEFIPMKK